VRKPTQLFRKQEISRYPVSTNLYHWSRYPISVKERNHTEKPNLDPWVTLTIDTLLAFDAYLSVTRKEGQVLARTNDGAEIKKDYGREKEHG
jgi:hypothetical protein